jgi:L-fuculose-phosphate aldolase
MIGVSGGDVVKCSGYAPFGTAELSTEALAALEHRMACLLGNHGVIALGKTPAKAFAVLEEVENLARIYIGTRMLGGGVILGKDEMAVVLERFKSYGKQAGEVDPTLKNKVEPPPYGGPKRL